ncbi:MAG: TRAP transporter small permease [Desulfarculaceae bacterium]|nr:TRAP transporter small permease [Desulfarculaceae bacterium]MCF8065511.1 TRAP transporter small permease [Desulfarculaceae bacterium]MCF8098679.1 TRAP transporter small permease [Desulfarculaceae bacterium]MCF8121464.1 TRAP transporter small permease [Desulfarculaceae bacterium]
MANRAEKVFDGLVTAGAAAAGLIFLFMMVAVCVDVVMRYWFQSPMGWVVEVCEYLLLYVTFLGAAWLLRKHGHVRVDLIYFYLSDRSIARLKFITAIAGTVACAILFIIGCQSTIDAFIRGNPEIKTLSIPKWTLLWVIPYGSLMLAIQFARQVLEHRQQYRELTQEQTPSKAA